jgi:apoptosis-inducing factor 2
VLLIEKNSHFQHLFAFPRFAVATGVETHKAFIPYVPGAFAGCPPGSGTVVQAKAIGLNNSAVQLDRQVLLDGKNLDSIPYSFLVSIVLLWEDFSLNHRRSLLLARSLRHHLLSLEAKS